MPRTGVATPQKVPTRSNRCLSTGLLRLGFLRTGFLAQYTISEHLVHYSPACALSNVKRFYGTEFSKSKHYRRNLWNCGLGHLLVLRGRREDASKAFEQLMGNPVAEAETMDFFVS